MDTKINFLKIGFFVIALVVSLLILVFWLGKYGFEKKKFDEYSIFFQESVSGLNIGSSIKYKGFDVGTVSEIKLNPNNSEEIQIDISIKKDTPIKEDNYAVLGNLGITGLKYIELKGGSNNSKLLEANETRARGCASCRLCFRGSQRSGARRTTVGSICRSNWASLQSPTVVVLW